MYTQNGSRDRVFEALIVRVLWPEWLAELERDRYDNAKFVPVTLVDFTAGYDTDSAVLFPETVAVRRDARATTSAPSSATARPRASAASAPPRPTCSRSSCRRTPPRCWPAQRLSQDAFVLWDLVHDRTHSHGDLPFDPFMIKQRMPYWMYSLEELRCDLTAFGEAVRLEARGLRLRPPRAVRDPLRPPLPLPDHRRPRAQLRRPRRPAALRLPAPARVVHWTDNRLTHRLGRGRRRRRRAARARSRRSTATASTARSSRTGSRRTTSSPATSRPRPARGGPQDARSLAEVEDPRPYLDEVLPDEFPLSMFYTPLKGKLAPALADRPADRARDAGALGGRRRRRRPLEGRVVAVAGAGGSLGPVVVRALAAEGARVAATDRDADLLAALGDAAAHTATADLLDAAGRRAWRDAVAATSARVDGLVHLVGGWRGGKALARGAARRLDAARAPAVPHGRHTTRAFAGDLRRPATAGASRSCLAAQAQRPSAGNAAYAATKAAAEAWTLALAQELAETGGDRQRRWSSTRSSRRRCAPSTPRRPTGLHRRRRDRRGHGRPLLRRRPRR